MESLKRKYFILRTIFLRQIELLIDKYVSFIWSKLVQGVCLQLVVIQNQLPSDFADLHCFLGQLYCIFLSPHCPKKMGIWILSNFTKLSILFHRQGSCFTVLGTDTVRYIICYGWNDPSSELKILVRSGNNLIGPQTKKSY